jgi:hypothetical protein
MGREIADTWPMASFNDVEFPYKDFGIKASLDHHVHKFLHRPGGEVEPLGRHLNEFSFKLALHTTIQRYSDYIQLLSEIISYGETEKAYDLVVPNMGNVPIKARLINYSRNYTALIRSGESVEFTFLEDTTDQFSFFNTVGPLIATLGDQRDVLLAAMLAASANDTLKLSLLNRLIAAIDRVLAARDQAELTEQLYAQQADNLFTLIGQFSALPYFQLPANYDAIEALFSIWGGVAAIATDPLTTGKVKDTFLTPGVMNVTELSLMLYGDTMHVVELIQGNRFDDATAIPASTLISYYD